MNPGRTASTGPGGWHEPEQVDLPINFHHATLTPDGKTMYLQGPLEKGRWGLFLSTKSGKSWSKPEEVASLNHPDDAVIWDAVEAQARSGAVPTVSYHVFLLIAVALGAIAVGGSARFLLLRESLVTGAIGLLFIGSLWLPRPLIYYLARSGELKRSAEDLSAFEAAWPNPHFVRAMYLMTWVWGLGLVFEAGLRCWLVWSWPVEQSLAIVPVISYAIYFSLLGWTLWYRSRLKGTARKRNG